MQKATARVIISLLLALAGLWLAWRPKPRDNALKREYANHVASCQNQVACVRHQYLERDATHQIAQNRTPSQFSRHGTELNVPWQG